MLVLFEGGSKRGIHRRGLWLSPLLALPRVKGCRKGNLQGYEDAYFADMAERPSSTGGPAAVSIRTAATGLLPPREQDGAVADGAIGIDGRVVARRGWGGSPRGAHPAGNEGEGRARVQKRKPLHTVGL
eukprot:jgi/Undpi1/69/HiC_scaffold_1.g00069.m1